MTAHQESLQIIEGYLAELRRRLRRMESGAREEIIAEIRVHLMERSAEGGPLDPGAVREALRRLGSAAELAAQYEADSLIDRAARTRSPWGLLRVSLRWARLGAMGFVIFIVTLSGYTAAVCFFLCGLLKPVFPDNIGLWVGPEVGFDLGFRSADQPPATELLGNWLPPVTLALGCLALIGTTRAMRAVSRLIGRRHAMRVGGPVRA